MANELILRAEPRTVHGKKVKRLRREGLVPGVVYGPVLNETISVSVIRKDFDKFFMQNGHSTIVNLSWDGGEQPVLIREVQVDPVKRTSIHVDFFAPNMRVRLQANVPVVLLHPHEDANGVLQSVLTEVVVEALPAELPHQLEVDISHMLEIGDQVHVSDLVAPGGVEIITEGEELIASLIAQAVEEEPEVEETEGEEGEEGEESEAGGEEGESPESSTGDSDDN